MRATAYDFVVVPLMGVPLNNIAALTFALGSGLAAAAGILFSVAFPVLDPYMGITFGWKAISYLPMLVIGIDRYGASAPLNILPEKFGFTAEQVVEKIKVFLTKL